MHHFSPSAHLYVPIVIEAIQRTMLSDFDPVNAIDFFGDEVVDRMVGTLRPWDARHLGETDRALAWIEKACAERNVFPLLFHADPFYDSLRRDSRLGSFLRHFNLGPH
jgi:hypothetical protein